VLAAVIGDEHPGIEGYAEICRALQHSATALCVTLETTWLPTPKLEGKVEVALAPFDALWCGPWGPYSNSAGAVRAIRYAREKQVPFLGTCAGFQHAAIEYARSKLGLPNADHAESNPDGQPLIIAPLPEPLLERTVAVVLDPSSRTARIYQRTSAAEKCRCAFGLNPAYLAPLHSAGLRVTGVNETGAATVLECTEHPFFFATLFLPEHASRAAAPHPLITAFVETAAAFSRMRG